MRGAHDIQQSERLQRRRRRRLQHRHRGPLVPEPAPTRRGGAGVPGRVPRRRRDGGRRRHVRSPHRQEGVGRVRCRHRQQRARRPARRRHRPRRRLRVEHRQQGRGPRAEQRLVPGVPRGLPVVVRRGSADRRQAGAPHRLGLRRATAGEGSGEPQGAARRVPDRPSPRCAVRPARRPASRCPCRRHRRPAVGAPAKTATAAATAPEASPSVAPAIGSDRQRRAAVPRLRRAPPPREQRERSRRVLFVARRLCDRR